MLAAKEKKLRRIAAEIGRCRRCRRGGTGAAVPGEGSADARVVFIGEAPGREEARTGRPFVGRSGKLLRRMIREVGLTEAEVFITSPVHYLPVRGVPPREMVLHGREHLIAQLEVIDPDVVVLLGSTACRALLDGGTAITKLRGTAVNRDGRTYLITFHPAYALRFPEGRRLLARDFRRLQRMLAADRTAGRRPGDRRAIPGRTRHRAAAIVIAARVGRRPDAGH